MHHLLSLYIIYNAGFWKNTKCWFLTFIILYEPLNLIYQVKVVDAAYNEGS